MRRRWSILTVGVVLAATAACTGEGEQPAPPPATSASAPAARYSGRADDCPTLSSPQAKEFRAVGKGRRYHSADPSSGFFWASSCAWGPASGDQRPLVGVGVAVFPNGMPPTRTGNGNAQTSFDHDRKEMADEAAEPGSPARVTEKTMPEGPAVFSADGAVEALTQVTLADNAVVTVNVWQVPVHPRDPVAHAEKLLVQLEPITSAITTEVLAQLR